VALAHLEFELGELIGFDLPTCVNMRLTLKAILIAITKIANMSYWW